MNRKKIYFKAFLFLVIAEILSIFLVSIVEYFHKLKIIDPINQIVCLGPALTAFLIILLRKKDTLKNLNFNRINIHVLYIILVYLSYEIILILVQIILGNMSININPDNFLTFIYGEKDGFINNIFLAGLLTILFSGFGEEIGWRGYLFNKLKSLPYFEMTILLNIIWALWHLPFFLFGGMGHTNVFVSYILFVVIAMELGIILNYIRIKTNSVFGAILLHPIPNIILMIVTGFTTVENEFWASHPNIIGIILLFPFAFYYYRKGKTLYYELE